MCRNARCPAACDGGPQPFGIVADRYNALGQRPCSTTLSPLLPCTLHAAEHAFAAKHFEQNVEAGPRGTARDRHAYRMNELTGRKLFPSGQILQGRFQGRRIERG